MASPTTIAVIGLGYVGLPLAVKLARSFPVIGFDAQVARVDELRRGSDRTGEVDEAELRASTLRLTYDARDLAGANIYIIAVPTPVDGANQPDLGAVKAACRTIGGVIEKGALVVLESTVYPGVTEEICGPEIEQTSGLRCGLDFFLGYSPERVNPGDREHSIERITKVVAGQTPEVTRRLAEVYGTINNGRIFSARDIRTAEAAKVIENAQRDINIAFINEVTQIFHRLGLSIYDVLDAARTKWNFLAFTPGLVGGHCIGVDPFYLASLAQRIGHDPEVILTGRRINDTMGFYIADRIVEHMDRRSDGSAGRALVLGLTFKENVPDLRNSKIVDVVRRLEGHGLGVDVHDPLADPVAALNEYRVALLPSLADAEGYDVVIGAVAHRVYGTFSAAHFTRLLRPGGMVADVKGMWRGIDLPPHIRRWQL
jgi:UDP-N-acetyl-D-galactosamine dehydrogenase